MKNHQQFLNLKKMDYILCAWRVLHLFFCEGARTAFLAKMRPMLLNVCTVIKTIHHTVMAPKETWEYKVFSG